MQCTIQSGLMSFALCLWTTIVVDTNMVVHDKGNNSVEALREKKRQDETQFTTKIGGKTSLGPNYFYFVL
jgi:hypothetical protein